MGRKRLLTMLGATSLATGMLATPAVAAVPDVTERPSGVVSADDPEVTVPIPGVGSLTVAADADPAGPSAHASVVADAEQGDLGLDADPSVRVTVSADGPAVDAEGGVGLLGERVDLDEVAAPVEDVVGTGDEPQPAEEPAAPASEQPRPAPAETPDGDVPVGSSAAGPLPRPVVLRAPADDVAETTAPGSVLAPKPSPAVAPPGPGAVAAPQLPIDPTGVPGLLRALTALLVAGAVGTWVLVRRELN